MLKLQACIKYCEKDNSAAKVSIYLFLFLNSNIKLVCVSCLQFSAGMNEWIFRCTPVCIQSLLEQLPQDDPDYIYNMGCLLYQDGKYEEACKKFTSAMQVLGYVPGTCL